MQKHVQRQNNYSIPGHDIFKNFKDDRQMPHFNTHAGPTECIQ